ncbi:tetratricopeptide repeat protein [Crossiella cryophila]|uniref:Tetratricopeptide (TPR) repeat protein n=1 Tax=Crossiella cryophila TaxID=43355 RepID=A0A7W7FWJ1_9PSEU|nr:hypothetical protein [Crossiella cryophila]MBB4681561.1 tetratricopeptide (TPR) repeat protein [Crossiella cryophila]
MEPELPEDVEPGQLDAGVRSDLRTLSKSLAELVAKHLVMAGRLIDEEPEQALAHARFARRKASRVGLVREATGLAAYHAGEWSEALAELRAARRMTGSSGHLAVMADCERALGRPERALELSRSTEAAALIGDEAVELRIVAAGARRDLGELDAAVVALQGPDLDEKRRDPWSARLFYAYADNLAAAGRTDEAIQWFISAAEADDEGETDAAERAIELGAGPVVPVEAEELGEDQALEQDRDEDEAGESAADSDRADAADQDDADRDDAADLSDASGRGEASDQAVDSGAVADSGQGTDVVVDSVEAAGSDAVSAEAVDSGAVADSGEAADAVVDSGEAVDSDAVADSAAAGEPVAESVPVVGEAAGEPEASVESSGSRETGVVKSVDGTVRDN